MAANPAPPLGELPAAEVRAAAAKARAAMVETYAAPPVEVEELLIPDGPNGDLPVRIIRPPNHTAPLPGILYFHGGGWVIGDFNSHGRLARELAAGVEAVVVFVEYSRSPEARFPVANEEAYFATQYVAENAAALGIDSSRIAVAGDSAGANMATVVAILAAERAGPALSGAVLFYPVTAANFETATYNEFAEGHFLTRDAMKWYWDQYLPDSEARLNPYASPLLAPPGQLRAHPPAFIMTCECDVLREEGEAYARRLEEAGVRVTCTRYTGTIHACLSLAPLANTPAVRSAIAAAVGHLRESFGK